MLNLKKLLTKILQCDFIVEKGTSGVWTYRKWASGVVECWATTNVTVTLTTVGTYYHRGTASISLPSGLFYSAPNMVNITCSQGFWCGLSSISASTVAAYFFDVTNTTNHTLPLYVEVRGVWK